MRQENPVLDTLAAAWPRDRDVQLARAQSAASAIAVYGERGHWAEMAAAEARLGAVAAAWPDDRDVQFERARGAAHAMLNHRRAGHTSNAESARARIAAAARLLPHDLGIQGLAAEEGVAYVEQMAADWPYGWPERVSIREERAGITGSGTAPSRSRRRNCQSRWLKDPGNRAVLGWIGGV